MLTTADSFEVCLWAKGILVAFQNKEEDAGQLTKTILQMSDTARKEGLLALEETTHDLAIPIWKKVFAWSWMAPTRNWSEILWKRN